MLTNRARSLESRHFLRNRLQRKPTGNPVPPLLPMQSSHENARSRLESQEARGISYGFEK
jgi:hypothetical protein